MKPLTRTGASIGACLDEELCVPLVCELCKAEIPQSAAVTFEGSDYAVHFCGLGCLETWKQRHLLKRPEAGAAQ